VSITLLHLQLQATGSRSQPGTWLGDRHNAEAERPTHPLYAFAADVAACEQQVHRHTQSLLACLHMTAGNAVR
jgi:hypothetical protein